jgi:hypothetical protein
MASGSARDVGLPCIQYFRKRVQFTDAGLAAGYKIGRLPARSYIIVVDWHVVTAFNSTTSDTVQLGSTQSGTDIVAPTTVHAGGITHHTAAAGLGVAATPSFTQDVDIWLKWVPGAVGTATAGEVVVIVAYIPDRDG